MKATRNCLLKRSCTSVLALGVIVSAGPAAAQIDSDGGLEEIVVTAQRRDQNMSDVPVSVSLVSGAEIEASGIKDMFDLQQNVPGLIVGQSQTTTSSNFAIRGIGSTANNFGVESSVGLYVDGVYRSRQSSMINVRIGMDIANWNSRVTLWGRNITDERSYHGSFDQPLGAGRMNSYPTEPATYGISFIKNWD